MHYRAQLRAEVEGISLNRLLSDAVAQFMGETRRAPQLENRLPDIRLAC